MNAIITLEEYLLKGKKFVIPDYQRGYVWGKISDNGNDAVSYMLDSLLQGFKNQASIFVQGITVAEMNSEIILVDGQQRTTFFYLLLKSLEYSNKFIIEYKVRTESEEFLKSLNSDTDITDSRGEEFQDIYFFKKTLRIIGNKLNGISKNEFLDWLLKNVKFLYIDIPETKAMKVFSMMNGSKAKMKDEELIKAELLRLVSLNDNNFERKTDNEKNAIEWDNNIIRGRYAREWDKWLQWWNKNSVKKLYKHSSVMGFLIKTYALENNIVKMTFGDFKNVFLKNDNQRQLAKIVFDDLRNLQKRFEDTFNDSICYNKIGAILRIIKPSDRANFIQWYFTGNKKTDKELSDYYKYSFLGMSHKDIISNNEEKREECFNLVLRTLSDNELYRNNPEEAFHLLLRLNIDEDNFQEEGNGRKFDFGIWDRNDSCGRSLEHIYPKSKVWHENTDESGQTLILNGNNEPINDVIDNSFISRDSCKWLDSSGNLLSEASEHSIGNLVLLYKDDNSSFGKSSFEEKKNIFFQRPESNKKTEIFKSRHLLHTIYKFANSEWKGSDIAKNKEETLKDFRKYYGK